MELKYLLNIVANRAAKEKNINMLIESLNKWLPLYEMRTKNRICAFLSEIAHETGGFVFFKELGKQSYFDKYEPGTRIGKQLGNTEIGDGSKYKGRGPLQITGRNNYKVYGRLISENLIEDPDLLLIPDIGVHCACEFWKQHNLNPLCDDENIREITKRINGGLNGLEERVKLFNILMKSFHAN